MLRFKIGLPTAPPDTDFREFHTKLNGSPRLPQKLAGNATEVEFEAQKGQNCEVWAVDQAKGGKRNELPHSSFRAEANPRVGSPYKLISVSNEPDQATRDPGQKPQDQAQTPPRDYGAFAKQQNLGGPPQHPQGGTRTSEPRPKDPTGGGQQSGDPLQRQRDANAGGSLGGGAASKTEDVAGGPVTEDVSRATPGTPTAPGEVAPAPTGVKGMSPSQEEGALRRQAKAAEATAVREEQRGGMAEDQARRAGEQAAEPERRSERAAEMGDRARAVAEEKARQRGTLPPQPAQGQDAPEEQPRGEGPEQKQERATRQADQGQLKEAFKTHQEADKEKLGQVEQKAEKPGDARNP